MGKSMPLLGLPAGVAHHCVDRFGLQRPSILEAPHLEAVVSRCSNLRPPTLFSSIFSNTNRVCFAMSLSRASYN